MDSEGRLGHTEAKGSSRDTGSKATNGGGQPKQESWEDAKAFYDNLSPKKKPKSVRDLSPPFSFAMKGVEWD